MRKQLRILIYPECYTNECLGEKLRELLYEYLRNRGVRPVIELRHSYLIGRDRIIKELVSLSSGIGKLQADLILAIIDYEKGPARHYIDKNFELQDLTRRYRIKSGA